ncbi:unnamed protein product [Trypanosoma congolense IL3000]|uniref:WGS project CAEQ00000000 data, annotated contig 1228 n=1 Tax=Trypanosoma congolense (strain IL3000) TaxID=1068625 RepID=F9W4U5_TRYCI|nr:unnamed protein product [Trypanosoma congolense IL3000]
MNFVKPLVSVLFFASWSIERLQHHGQRLWKEIYRDLATLNNFSVNVESGEAKPADNQIPLYYGSYDERNIAEEVDAVVVPGDDEERPSQSAERQNDADDESGSDCNTVVKHSGRESFASEEQAQMEASKVLSDKSVVDRGSVVEHSDTSSNATVVHGKSVTPAADEGVTVCPESVKQQETNKKKKRGPTNDKNDVYRIVHRDYLTLHIHFSCMLLAHLCSGMQQFPGQQDELDSRFYVINLAFRVLYKLLTGTVVDRTYGAPTATKYWLNLTLTRLKHRSSMSAQDRSRTHRMLDCWDALLLEESLVFEGTKVSENYADCPASAVDIVFSELFMGIAGNGRSVNGRRFLQRCLHNSSKWLTRGFMMEDRGWSRKHQVHSHISLLCMKVVRAISSCLSLSTKTLIVECNWRQLWMEKMTMQLTEANLLRDLISVLCNRVKSYHTTSLCRNNQPVVGAKYVSCIPVLTTLGCLLRDIVTHEIFYSSEPQGQGKGEMKPEMLALTTPFGSNSPFPSTYLLVCFWSAFAFLLTYNAWAVACDLLTVFHRYGCLRLLEVIPKPSFCTLGNFQLIVRPECAAVQLALLQQGRITAMQKKDNGVLRSTIGRDYRHNTMVVLTYLDEFTKDNDCGAAILAFTELVILCDWVSLNLTGLCQEARRTTPDKETQGAGDSADASTRGRAESNGPAVYSLSEYLRHFGEKWKQSMVMFSGGAGSSFQNLSLRMRYVLDEMFQVCLKVFNIPSLDVMLNTVVIAKKDEKQSDSPLSYSPADNLDLCSLHSRSEMEGERCDLYDDSVLSFQHYFEILVMVPFMSLFQWTATSFPLWSKILSLISALFWYHEQEYSYITNLLLKILPDLEAALNDTVLQNTLEDVSDVYLGDRLMISVLTEGVLAKVESLKSYRSPMPSYYSDKATYRPTPLVSLIEDEKLINDIMKHLMDFLTPKMAPSTGNGNHLSVMSLMGDFPSRGREKTASRRRLVKETVEDDARSAKSTHAESKCTPPRATVRFSTDGDAEEGSSSSHSDVEEEHRKHQTQHEVTCSHRFGEFFYEVYDEASLAPGPIYQVPVEYYYCMPQERLPSTSPDGEEDVASGFSDFMEFHGSEARTRSVGNADISSHDPDSLNTSLTTSEADVFSRKS